MSRIPPERAEELVGAFGVTYLDGKGPTLFDALSVLEMQADIMHMIRTSETQEERDKHESRLLSLLESASDAGYDLLISNQVDAIRRMHRAAGEFNAVMRGDGERLMRQKLDALKESP